MSSINDQFSGRSQYYLVMDVSIGTQDYANNRTLVSWSARIDESPEWGSYSFSNNSSWSAYVAGNLVGSGTFNYDFRSYNSLALGSGSIWLYHDGNGYLSFNYDVHVGGSSVIGVADAYGSDSAARIPKAPTAAGAPVASAIGATNMTLTWAGSGNNNGAAIDQYLLRRSPSTDLAAGYTDYVYGGSTLSATVTDLVPGTSYYWRVYAHNSQGYAPASGVTLAATLSGVYVSDGTNWIPAPVYVSDGTNWNLASIYASDGTTWVQGT